MSPAPNPPTSAPEEYDFFAFVVDGEVAFKFPVHSSLELMVAAMSSNPTVIKLSEQDKTTVREGWTYDGVGFNPA
jgi:hypothetical protein